MPEGVGYGPQNTASTGLNLNVIGNHAYAASGIFDSITTTQTLLKFTSGNFYFVGEITVSGGVEFSSGGLPNGTMNAFQLSFNGTVLAVYKTDTNDEDMFSSHSMPIIIPPYTEVQIDMVANANNTGDMASCAINGRIYGKVD